MAVAFESNTTAQSIVSNPTLTITGVPVTSANLLVYLVSVSANRTVSSIVRNGQSATYRGRQYDALWCAVEIWTLANPSTGTFDATITISSDITQKAASVVALTDASLTIPTPIQATASAANPSLSFTTVSGDIVLGIMTSDAQAATVTQDGTSLLNINSLDSDIDVAAMYKTASGTSTSLNWTDSATENWAAIGVVISSGSATLSLMGQACL